MKRFLKIFLIALGVFALANIVMGVLTGALWLVGNRSVPERIILEVDLERGFIEYVPNDPVAQVTLSSLTRVRDVVDALEKASGDERVTGLIARVGGVANGAGRSSRNCEDAVIAFRSHGKRAVAYAETFGDFGPGNGAYYLASAFDEIYLQPTGCLGLTGLIMEQPFLRGALDKLGVTPRLDRREEYKNAVNTFTEHGYTEPHRESVQQIMESVFSQIVEGIADARDLSEEQVRGLVDKGPLLAQEALDAGLVDGLLYRDEVYEQVKKGAGGATPITSGSTWRGQAGPHAKGAAVALIYGVGPVMRGASGYSPAFGPTMGSDTVTAAFRTAIKDNNVKAIIFRVDSPGGSAVASDTIWRETVRAREAGKPVIVSMGNLAGSGGYFVAMAADKIVAQPGTLTGSIGRFRGEDAHLGILGQTRRRLGRGPHQRERDDVGRHARLQSGAVDTPRSLSGPNLRGFHGQSGRGTQTEQRSGARNR